MADQYRTARIIHYGGAYVHQNTLRLEEVSMVDQDFQKRLNGNERLQSVFRKLTTLGDSSIQSEVEQIAMIYIEHALLNRARFAITQKHELTECYDDILSETMRRAIVNDVNSELEYVSNLLEKLEDPLILPIKSEVSLWLDYDLEPGAADDEETMNVVPDD